MARVDHGLIVWNLLLLMAISFTPFPTAVMAEHLPHPGWDRNVAVAFYCGSFTADGALLQPAVAARGARPAPDSRARERRARPRHHARLLRRAPSSTALATAAAFVSVPAALAIVAGLALFYILPRRGAHRNRLSRRAVFRPRLCACHVEKRPSAPTYGQTGQNALTEEPAMTITPFLWFDTQAEEAMTYYALGLRERSRIKAVHRARAG